MKDDVAARLERARRKEHGEAVILALGYWLAVEAIQERLDNAARLTKKWAGKPQHKRSLLDLAELVGILEWRMVRLTIKLIATDPRPEFLNAYKERAKSFSVALFDDETDWEQLRKDEHLRSLPRLDEIWAWGVQAINGDVKRPNPKLREAMEVRLGLTVEKNHEPKALGMSILSAIKEQQGGNTPTEPERPAQRLTAPSTGIVEAHTSSTEESRAISPQGAGGLIVDAMSRTLAGIDGVLSFEKLSNYDKDVVRATRKGVTVSDEAGAYIDLISLNEGPKRWIRDDAVRNALLAEKMVAELADVVPLVYDAAMENPPNYYRRDLLIAPDRPCDDPQPPPLTVYTQTERTTLYNGDCLDVLRSLPSASVEAVVTDPPAGIAFMGKDWDKDRGGRDGWIAWLAGVMEECKRVLKPGGHALIWALPRTSHWTATAVENAGFEVRDVIMHLFGTGFPKSLDVSKAIDKAAGAERTKVRTAPRPETSGTFAGATDTRPWIEEARVRGYHEVDGPDAITEAAKQWDGWGTALKPAAEHWILARKPLEGTVAANVLAHGTGAINIDGCRIEGIPPSVPQPVFNSPTGKIYNMKTGEGRNGAMSNSTQGRWPANVTLDDQSAALLDEQSGTRTSGKPVGIQHHRGGFHEGSSGIAVTGYGDSGGASRFFYVAKPSPSERNAGLDGMPVVHAPKGNYEGRDMSNPKNHLGGMQGATGANHHPTVKPIALMRYLARLITPPNGTVLDPFMGSGTTGIAAIQEGFRFIGIEREAEYITIAAARIAHAEGGADGNPDGGTRQDGGEAEEAADD